VQSDKAELIKLANKKYKSFFHSHWFRSWCLSDTNKGVTENRSTMSLERLLTFRSFQPHDARSRNTSRHFTSQDADVSLFVAHSAARLNFFPLSLHCNHAKDILFHCRRIDEDKTLSGSYAELWRFMNVIISHGFKFGFKDIRGKKKTWCNWSQSTAYLKDIFV